MLCCYKFSRSYKVTERNINSGILLLHFLNIWREHYIFSLIWSCLPLSTSLTINREMRCGKMFSRNATAVMCLSYHWKNSYTHIIWSRQSSFLKHYHAHAIIYYLCMKIWLWISLHSNPISSYGKKLLTSKKIAIEF